MNLHGTPPGPPNPHDYPNLWPEDSLEHIVANGFAIGMIQADQEVLDFASMIRDVIKPQVIVELGTLCGGMMYVMDRMSPPGLRISVDMPWEQRDPTPRWPPDMLRREIPGMVWVEGNIHTRGTWQRVVEVLNGSEIDLLYVDADHSYSGVAGHWAMYSHLVRSGGYVAFHDVRNGWPCGNFYDELCKQYQHTEFFTPEIGFGIGVIRV